MAVEAGERGGQATDFAHWPLTLAQFMIGIQGTESGGNYTTKNSRSGAYGAYQFMPQYWEDYKRYAKQEGMVPPNPGFPPDKYAQDIVAAGVFKYYYKKYGGNWNLVATAWHCGHGCADAAVRKYGNNATPEQIDKAVATKYGAAHGNESEYIYRTYNSSNVTSAQNWVKGRGGSSWKNVPSTDPGELSDKALQASMQLTPDQGGGPADPGPGGGPGVPGGVILSEGSRGEDVRTLQSALNTEGFNLDVDGVFGPKTAAAVNKYQKDNGLTVDGKVGPQTAGSLGITLSGGQGGAPGAGGEADTEGTKEAAAGGTYYKVEGLGTVIVYELDYEGVERFHVMYVLDKDDESTVSLKKLKNGGNLTQEKFDATFPNPLEGGDALELTGITEKNFQTWFEETLLEYTGYNRVALEDPEVRAVLMQALLDGASEEEFQAKLTKTKWWQETNDQSRRWGIATDTERQRYVETYTGALRESWRAAWGIQPAWDDKVLVDLATRVASGEMTQGQAISQIQDSASANPNTPEANFRRQINKRPVDIENLQVDLDAQAREWGVRMSENQLARWATGVHDLDTELTRGDFDGWITDQAEIRYGSRELGSSNRGREMSVQDWSTPYREAWSELLETDDSLDLIFDKRFNKALRDNKTVAEFQDQIRETDQWKGTDNARDEVSGTLATLGSLMGYS